MKELDLDALDHVNGGAASCASTVAASSWNTAVGNGFLPGNPLFGVAAGWGAVSSYFNSPACASDPRDSAVLGGAIVSVMGGDPTWGRR